jgi:hypothetical protein
MLRRWLRDHVNEEALRTGQGSPRKPWSFHRATKNRDLLPQREILEAEGAPGLEGGEERAKERRNHAEMLSPGEGEDQV